MMYLTDLDIWRTAKILIGAQGENALLDAAQRGGWAIQDDHWATRLCQIDAVPDKAKACLKTVDGINWRESKNERAAFKTEQIKPKVRDPRVIFDAPGIFDRGGRSVVSACVRVIIVKPHRPAAALFLRQDF